MDKKAFTIRVLTAMLLPGIAIIVQAVFMRLSTLGYLTPQDASEFTKQAMDWVTLYGLPGTLTAVVGYLMTPNMLIKTVNALPKVDGVAVAPDVANQITSPTVTVIESLPAAIADAKG